jgi:STE24 endopeptidase
MTMDPRAATSACIDGLGTGTLAKAAACTTGNHWLLLWGLLVGACVTLVVVQWGVLDRLEARLGRRAGRAWWAWSAGLTAVERRVLRATEWKDSHGAT